MSDRYRKNGNGLETEDTEQAVIELVNALYKEPSTLTNICKLLQERGIKTRNGKACTPQQVKRLIAGYENTFSKNDSKLGRHLRQFITAIA